MNNLKRLFWTIYYFFKSSTCVFRSREELEQWQKSEFKKLQGKVLSKSPWYKDYDYEELNQYPLMNKKHFMSNFNQINTVGLNKDEAFRFALTQEKSRDFSTKLAGCTVGLSSGTSGNRGIFLASEHERAIWAGNILAKMLPKPRIRKHKIAFFLRANSPLYEGVDSRLIKFQFFDLIVPLQAHIQALNKYQPSILIAPAQVLRLLALAPDLDISPEKIISVAEVLESTDENIISQRFEQKVHQVYQCTEGFLACTCEHGNLHVNEDIIILEKEYLDDVRFVPIITDLRRQSQPIVRYRLDDILIEDKTPCPCGSVFTRLKKIEGRCDDILKLKNNHNDVQNIFPDFIRRAIISSSEQVEEYMIMQVGEDKLAAYIKPLNQMTSSEVEIALSNLWQRLAIEPVTIDFFPWQDKPLDQKRRRVQRQAF